jgi:hypothetical protein
MSHATDQLESAIVTHLLRTGSWTKPTTLYAGIYLTMPADDGTGGVEPTGGAYARVACGPSDAWWSAAGINLQAIQFPRPTADWGLAKGWGLFTASSGGTPWLARELRTPVNILTGETAAGFEAGAISIAVD